MQGGGNGEVTGVIGPGTGTGPINLSKNGSGTWTLKGANTYTGNTTINGGTLVLSATGSIASSPVIDPEGSGIFDVTAFGSGYTLGASIAQKLQGTGTVNGTIVNGAVGTISPAGNNTAGTLNIQNLKLGSVSGGIVYFDLSNSTSSGNDLLNVTGNLSALGSSSPQSTTFNINMLNGSLATGNYKLVNYGTWDSGGSISNIGLSGVGTGGATTRQIFGLSRTGNEIDLTVSGSPASLVWKGNVSGTWDRNPSGTLNWLNGGNADKYYDLDSVTFDSNGAARPNVNVSGAWTPSAVTVNYSGDYTFSGTGGLTGGSSMTLTKSGSGKLILSNTGGNNFGGGVSINAGTLQLGDGTTLNAGTIGAANVSLTGTLEVNRPDNLILSNVISGAGNLLKQGSGQLLITGNNSGLTGPATISGGTVVMGDNSGNSLTQCQCTGPDKHHYSHYHQRHRRLEYFKPNSRNPRGKRPGLGTRRQRGNHQHGRDPNSIPLSLTYRLPAMLRSAAQYVGTSAAQALPSPAAVIRLQRPEQIG